MSRACYKIKGGDFERGGTAASGLKEALKRIGAEPAAIRRAVIAAYEAEMNVVIHAHSALMCVRMHNHQVDVEVDDRGPGIPDIELAMRDGYSTAPPAIRELGFGAGMGLPNIRKNSDAFSIESTVGHGTRVRFSVTMRQREGVRWERNSLRIVGEACTHCLRCLQACPTRAVRVHRDGPQVLSHLCTDCTNCARACPSGAITVDVPDALPARPTGTIIVPVAFMVQFGDSATPEDVVDALREIGFGQVVVASAARRALREACLEWASREAAARPVISPTCPAVVNLIQVRFPSLIPHVAPFLPPLEAVVHSTRGEGWFIPLCPAHCTAVAGAAAPSLRLTSPAAVRRALSPILARTAGPAPAPRWAAPPHEAPSPDVLQIAGMHHVMRLLDGIETGLYGDLTLVEPYACELGCFGSPLLWEDPFVARHRWLHVADSFRARAAAVPRPRALEPREGVRLDPDMDRAIAKLAQIEELARSLPGRNCGACGAPDCTTFAEDVVLGRATINGCHNYVAPREDAE